MGCHHMTLSFDSSSREGKTGNERDLGGQWLNLTRGASEGFGHYESLMTHCLGCRGRRV